MTSKRNLLQRATDRALGLGLDWLERMGAYPPFPAASGNRFSPTAAPMGIAFVGCGFVADFYASNLPSWPALRLCAVHDANPGRAKAFARRNAVRSHESLDALLNDPEVEIVVNLTNPASHADITRAALLAGKHVFSEKPLALDPQTAADLFDLARARGLKLAAAPSTILGETARALQAAMGRGDIGTPRLVYAELDDGPVHRMRPQEWASAQGTPWPWVNELTTGCTLEHAAYHLSWLVSLFGEIESVTGFARVLDAEKGLDGVEPGPDFSIGCIVFKKGVVARITCSTIVAHDHRLRIIGDTGELCTDACWHDRSPVFLRRYDTLTLRAGSYPVVRRHALLRSIFGLDGRRSDLSPAARWRDRLARHRIDYAAGIADLARAIREDGEPAMSPENTLAITQAMLAIDGVKDGSAQ